MHLSIRFTARAIGGLALAAACNSEQRAFEDQADGGAGQGGQGPQGAQGGLGADSAAGADGSGADAGDTSAAGAGDGGAAGSSLTAPLAIETAALHDGWFNMDYSVSLSASGGTGEGYEWSVTSGTLPPGLGLTSDGTLRGIPTASGEYAFEVEVSDGADSLSKELTVTIRRKRWLAYVSDETVDERYLLRVVDLTTPAFEVTLPTTPSHSGPVEINYYDFSPNGRYLAYLMDATADEVDDLYVLDLSGEVPGIARKVNQSGSVTQFVWSGDSTRLAFVQDEGAQEQVRWLDLSAGVPTSLTTPLLASYSAQRVLFARSALVLKNDTGAWTAARWDGDTVSLDELAINSAYRPFQYSHDSDMVMFTSDLDENFCAAAQIVNLATSDVAPMPLTSSWLFSRDLVYSGAYSFDTLGFEFYATSDLFAGDPAPVLTVAGGSGCDSSVHWGSTDVQAAVISGDKVKYVSLAEPASATEVAGSYATPGGLDIVRFSNDGAWLMFLDDVDLWASQIVDDVPKAAKRLNTVLPNPSLDHVERPRFSPNSRMALYHAAQQSAGVLELYVVDLKDPGNWRKVNGAFGVGGATLKPHETQWSADSSVIAYLAEKSKSGTSAPGPGLYVADMLQISAIGEQIGTSSCTRPDTNSSWKCQGATSLALEP